MLNALLVPAILVGVLHGRQIVKPAATAGVRVADGGVRGARGAEINSDDAVTESWRREKVGGFFLQASRPGSNCRSPEPL